MSDKEKEKKTISLSFSQVELPQPTVDKNGSWMRYGKDNDYPSYLTGLLNGSGLHNRILTSKVEDILGAGVKCANETPDYATNEFIAHPNDYEDLNALSRKLIWDLELYGGFYVECIWSKDGESIAEIHHVPYGNVRLGKADRRGVIAAFWYSEDWKNSRKKENEPEELKAFTNKQSGLKFVKPYTPDSKYYPRPSYVGAITYVEADREIGNFHLAHLKNGMNLSTIITYCNGVPLEEEREETVRQVKNHFSSTDNAGKVMVNFVDDKDKAPIVTTPSSTGLDKQFIQLQDTVMQAILVAHGVVSPMLVGIKTPGQLGGAQELETAHKIYDSEILEPRRKIVLDALNEIASINGVSELAFAANSPFEFTYSEQVLSQIMTRDELRESIGLSALENKEQL